MRPLDQIRNEIGGDSEDARFAAWMELYRSEEPAAKNEIRKIVTESDPTPKLLLIRFLTGIPEEGAVSCLTRFLEDDDEVIGNAAKKALDRNHYDLKNQKLLPLLHSPCRRARIYAIEKVSRGGLIEAIPALLSLLPRADTELLLELLSAMRYLCDRRTLVVCSAYFNDSREEVRFRLALILGSLHEAGIPGTRHPLLSLLNDQSPKVRQTTLWSLRRSPSRKDFALLAEISLKDPDPSVRRESLPGFSFFQTTGTVRHLLKVMTSEPERTVRLQCEGVLLGMPPQLLIKGLKKILKEQADPAREKAILLFASLHQQSSFFFDFLAQELKKQKEARKKILLFQALGELGDSRGIPLLEESLTAPIPLAYAALSALTQLWKQQENPGLIPYLQNPQFPPLLKQIVLKFVVRRPKTIQNRQDLISILIELLDHENINIRYLSSQALVQVAAESAYEALLKTFLKESDPTSRKFLADHLVFIGLSHPEHLASSLVPYKNQSETIIFILSLIKKTGASRNQFLKLFELLLKPPLALHETGLQSEIARFLLHFVQEDPPLFPLVLEKVLEIPGGITLLRSFVRLLSSQSKPGKIVFPFSEIKNRFEMAGEEEKGLMIDLAGFSTERSPIPFLVNLITNPALNRLHSSASKSLNRLIEEVA